MGLQHHRMGSGAGNGGGVVTALHCDAELEPLVRAALSYAGFSIETRIKGGGERQQIVRHMGFECVDCGTEISNWEFEEQHGRCRPCMAVKLGEPLKRIPEFVRRQEP